MRTRTGLTIAILLAALVAGCGSSSSTSTSSTASGSQSAGAGVTAPTTPTATTATKPLGPENVPLEPGPQLAPASTTTPGTKVDGLIECAPIEQLAYHIHAHLQVYVDGSPRSLPAAIGMLDPVYENTPYGRFYGAQKCYYWLHTHASDGIIHIESPTARIYTLGEFFDEWRQPLSGDQVAGDRGPVTAIVNDKPWTKSPRDIPLEPHATIELAVGKPVPKFKPVDWGVTQL
jgi:hypothetical protein